MWGAFGMPPFDHELRRLGDACLRAAHCCVDLKRLHGCRRYDPMDGGGRTASGTAVEGNAGAVADDCMDAGGTPPWMEAVEPRREQAVENRVWNSGRRLHGCRRYASMDGGGRTASGTSGREPRLEHWSRRPVCLRQRAAICTQTGVVTNTQLVQRLPRNPKRNSMLAAQRRPSAKATKSAATPFGSLATIGSDR
jgi:hypothetical protein